MSDFHVIKYKGGMFTIPVFNQLHGDSLAFIKEAIADRSHKMKVVITHHVPTFMHYPPQYKGDILNQAFASELHDLIASSAIHSWIYGHHHINTADFKIGNTHMLTNQLGYVKHGEHITYSRGKVIRMV